MWSIWLLLRSQKLIIVCVVVLSTSMSFYGFQFATSPSLQIIQENSTTPENDIIATTSTMRVPTSKLSLPMVTALNHIKNSLENVHQPKIKGLIVTSWPMTEADIFARLMVSSDSFCYFDPLQWTKSSRIVDESDPDFEDSISLLYNFLQCQHQFAKDRWWRWPSIYHFKDNFCSSSKWKSMEMCSDPLLMDPLCSLFPHRIVITQKISLDLAASLLQEIPELQIMFISRDPRSFTGLADPLNLCQSYFNDVCTFWKLHSKYSNRVHFQRLEDIIEDPDEFEAKLHNAFGFEVKLEKEMRFWKHDQWKKEKDFEEVDLIQKLCESSMANLGYKKATDEFDLFRFDSLERKELINMTSKT